MNTVHLSIRDQHHLRHHLPHRTVRKEADQFPLLSLGPLGVLSGLIAMITTVMFDTMLWGKIIWPEMESMWFNLYLNKSHLWGTSPFYWYFAIAIPKLMLFSLPFLGLTPSGCMLKFYPVVLAHVGLHSFLPHKELRFIIYIAPLLNICAANTIATLFNFIQPTKADPKKGAT